MGKRYSIEELTCPECGWVAKNANGLRGHRQFKHGVLPSSSTQLQRVKGRVLLDKSENKSSLEQRLGDLEERLGFAKPDTLERLLSSSASAPITDSVKRISSKLATLEQQQGAVANNLSSLKSELSAFGKHLATAKKQVTGLAKGVKILYSGTAEQIAAVKERLEDEAGKAKLAQFIKEYERGKN